MLELTADQILEMTGTELLLMVGEPKYLGKQFAQPFMVNGKQWHVYQTMGQGRNYGKLYVHLKSTEELKVVDDEGNDTGAKITRPIHFRGLRTEALKNMQYVG